MNTEDGEPGAATYRRWRCDMEAVLEGAALEIKRLRRCMNDLVSVLALPAMWAGLEPLEILTLCVNALVETLDLDFVYARAQAGVDGAATEALKVNPAHQPNHDQREFVQALSRWLSEENAESLGQVRRNLGGEEISIFRIQMGIEGDLGAILAGSQRAAFPDKTESLVLQVAANQLTIGLQHALRLGDQKRVADELDRRVAQRTTELAAANEELQLQAGLLQRLPVSAWTLKPDGTPEFVNQVWLEYSGQTLEFVQSHPEAWMIAVHPEDREAAAIAFKSGVGSGRGFAIETRSRRARDGVYRWHLQQAVVLRDAEGNVLKFVGTTTDIDNQKRAEEALRSRERDLRLIINTMPVLAWSAWPDGRVDFFNQRWLDYAGLSPGQAKDWGWAQAFHPDDIERVTAHWQSMMGTGESGEIEARLRRFDGDYRWFLFRAEPLRDESGSIVKWYGTNTDIEDRKCGEEALRKSEQSVRLILDGIAGLVAIMSATGELETVNQQVLDYFGKTVAQLKGWSTSNAVHPDDLARVISAWTGAIETASIYDVEHRLRRADGSFRWFHARGLPLCDAEGRILRWYVLLTDINDRKQAEEELRNTQEALSHVARATSLSTMTASIAHEVNQPLSGIITNASTCLRMLDANPPNIDGARETAKRTIRDGNRASDIITRLRTLFSKKEPSLEPMDLNEAVREVIALLLNELQKNGAILQHDFADDLPIVEGDRIQLQQVMLNLIRNASDAMIGIDDRPKLLQIRTERIDGNVCVIVQDSGTGFDPAVADRLFESFYTTKPEGMGIGLSVSRSIIEAHGGRMWARTNDGPGATFAFSIPRGTIE